jgi:chemotaxis-related protein WspB
MLFVLFQLGADRYAISAASLAEIIPMVRVKALPLAPKGVAGMINYRGQPIPLLDLCELATGSHAASKLSTRILIAHFQGFDSSQRLLGLLAEKTTETIRLDENSFSASGVDLPEAPYLGPVARDASGLIQRVEVSKLIPAHIQNLLFQPANG